MKIACSFDCRIHLPLAVLFLVSVEVAPRAASHETTKAPTVSPQRQFQPSPLPDRVILTWADDPATSMNVTWRTDETADQSFVQFIKASEILGNLEQGDVPHCRDAVGTNADFASDLGPARIHEVMLERLDPATMYAYRVGDGANWSEWFQFQTAAANDEPFTFIYFGDAQNAIRSLWSRVVREANLRAPRAAFMLHAGDLINTAESDAEWGEWFGAGGWLNGSVPSVATPGNHEYGGKHRLDSHWRRQFAFPENGPPGLEETVYWFDYQGARLVSLNSNEQIERQSDWLRAVFSDPNRPKWTIATFHHPVFSAAKDRDNPELRKEWQPVLEELGVDLVLQGHDHAYARSGFGGPRNVPEGIRKESGQTVYVVSVSGPKQYPVGETWDMSRIASGVQLFQIIHVHKDHIDYEARTATGALYDAFAIRKDEQGQSTLTDRIPETPEIRH